MSVTTPRVTSVGGSGCPGSAVAAFGDRSESEAVVGSTPDRRFPVAERRCEALDPENDPSATGSVPS